MSLKLTPDSLVSTVGKFEIVRLAMELRLLDQYLEIK